MLSFLIFFRILFPTFSQNTNNPENLDVLNSPESWEWTLCSKINGSKGRNGALRLTLKATWVGATLHSALSRLLVV